MTPWETKLCPRTGRYGSAVWIWQSAMRKCQVVLGTHRRPHQENFYIQTYVSLPMQAVWCWVKPGGHLQVNPPMVFTHKNWQLCCLVEHSSRSGKAQGVTQKKFSGTFRYRKLKRGGNRYLNSTEPGQISACATVWGLLFIVSQIPVLLQSLTYKWTATEPDTRNMEWVVGGGGGYVP